MTQLAWVVEAEKWIGQQEVPGPGFNAWIRDGWHSLPGGKWFWDNYGLDDSKLPWCGMFMARTFKACGIPFPAKYSSALAWLSWGQKLAKPASGCVVIFTREGGGHVGIVVGVDERGFLRVLGGNQKDGVRIMSFDPARAEGYRWPPGRPVPLVLELTKYIVGKVEVSRNEA